MIPLAEQIKSKGYWESLIRPIVPRDDRINDLSSVPYVMDAIAVHIRGWNVPHVNLNAQIEREQGSVGQNTEWKYFHELWRVFQSGQFYYLAGMRHDWGAQVSLGLGEEVPAGVRTLGIGDALYRMTEIMLFAGNYVRRVLDGEASEIGLTVGGLRERYLIVDDPSRFGFASNAMATTEQPFRVSVVVDGGTAQDGLLRMARDETRRLFRLFGRDVADPVLEESQKKVGAY